MKKTFLVMALAVVILGLAAAGFLFRRDKAPAENAPAENIVGGDRDEHGCIGSAGYSWNQERGQCVRVWEVPVMVEAEAAVKKLLAQKYNKPLDGVMVKVIEIAGDYVAGVVSFTPGETAAGQGQFLAFKQNNAWRLAYDGNGAVDCLRMRQEYGFTDEILKPNFCD